MSMIISVSKTPERVVIQFYSSNNNNANKSVSLLVIRLVGLVPYSYDKVVPYKYNATMIENGQEVSLLVPDSVVNIADVAKVTRNSRVFSPVFPKVVEDVSVGKKEKIHVVDPVSVPTCQYGESNKLKTNDDDEVLHFIKRSEFNIVE